MMNVLQNIEAITEQSALANECVWVKVTVRADQQTESADSVHQQQKIRQANRKLRLAFIVEFPRIKRK